MSGFTDYYELLGVAPTADEAAIVQAYRRACFRWHPDRNPQSAAEAHARFLSVGEAYAVLSSPEARRRFDGIRAAHVASEASRAEAPPHERASGPKRFDDVVREACRTTYDAAADWDRKATVERHVLDLMRDLAAPHLSRREVTRAALGIQIGVLLFALAVSSVVFLGFVAEGTVDTTHASVIALPLPLGCLAWLLRSVFRLSRDRRVLHAYRPVAEEIVRQRMQRRAR